MVLCFIVNFYVA